KAVVQKYFEEYWGKANVSIVDELCSSEYLIHYPMHIPRPGMEASKKMLLEFRERRSPISPSVPTAPPLIAEGDYVVSRWIGGRHAHTGVAFGDLAVGKLDNPNTSGRKIFFSGTTIFKLGLVPGPNPGKEVVYGEERA
ncbi:hypothetical protein FN846DRAFT_773455, partial [Sphaerosporella brunnea]